MIHTLFAFEVICNRSTNGRSLLGFPNKGYDPPKIGVHEERKVFSGTRTYKKVKTERQAWIQNIFYDDGTANRIYLHHSFSITQYRRVMLLQSLLLTQSDQNRFVAFTLNGAGAIVNPGRGTSDGSGSPSGRLNQNA